MTLTFYTNPQSRGQIVRWMLEEIGEPYEQVLLDFGTTMKAPEYLAINPMGKVPTIRHGSVVVTEGAAICAYLADAFPAAGLAPPLGDRGEYYRWLFFAAGPVEAAITARWLALEPPADKSAMVGYGSVDQTIELLAEAVTGRTYLTGDRFSAADVYVGSQIDFGLMFKTFPDDPRFTAYVEGLRERPAYRRAKEIDMGPIAKS